MRAAMSNNNFGAKCKDGEDIGKKKTTEIESCCIESLRDMSSKLDLGGGRRLGWINKRQIYIVFNSTVRKTSKLNRSGKKMIFRVKLVNVIYNEEPKVKRSN